MQIVRRIKNLLLKAYDGKADVSDEIIEKFGERCADAMRKHFKPHSREWYIRPSALGRDIRLLQCEKLGLDKDESDESFTSLKFLWGDLTEAVVMSLMEACGIPIDSEQEEVGLTLGHQEIRGTYDVIIDGKLYDIKSASDYSFRKFKKGYRELQANDAFGYCMQNSIYSRAKGVELGGWIVVNKTTGEICICSAEGLDTFKYIEEAARKVELLGRTENKKDIDHQMPVIPDMIRSKPTGRWRLDPKFNYFPYKDALGWSQHLEKKGSKYYLKEAENEEAIN